MNRDLKLTRRRLFSLVGGAAALAAAATQVQPPRITPAEFPMGIHADELIVDNFAGGGGASTGIEWALGRPVDIAINHDRKALALHAANHTRTRHLCESVWKVDIKKEVAGRRVGLAWFSPDCTFFSKARGAKPIRVKGKEVRGLAWVALRWAGLVKPRVIVLENVEEFQNWGMVHRDREGKRDRERCRLCRQIFDGRPCPKHKGVTFKRWVTQLRNLGYEVDFKERRAMIDGAPTIRKRLFVIARCDGQPIVWPEPTHGPGLLPYRTAAECIDFSIPCPSIFLKTKDAKKLGIIRPLADKSMARIAKGIKKYVLDSQRKPFLVTLTHAGGDRVNDVEQSFRTVTGANRGEVAVVDAAIAPFIATYHGSNRPGGDRTASVEQSIRTIDTENRFALVSAFLARQFGKSTGAPADQPIGSATEHAKTAVVSAYVARTFGQSVGSATGEPVGSITADGGGHTAIIAAHLAQHNSERTGVKAGRPMDAPTATVTNTGHQVSLVTSQIMKMRGTNIGSSTDEPIHTISSKGMHHAEVRTFLEKYLGGDPADYFIEINGEKWVIVDIGMRMLTPRELFRAQGFPDWGRTIKFNIWRDQSTREGVDHQLHQSMSTAKPAKLDLSQKTTNADARPVAVSAHINCAAKTLVLRSPEKLFKFAKHAADSVWFPLPIEIENFVRANAYDNSLLGKIADPGRVEFLESVLNSTVLKGGENYRMSSGAGIWQRADAASNDTAKDTTASTFTTSQDTQSTRFFDLNLQTLFSFVGNAIDSCIPQRITGENSLSVSLHVENSYIIEGGRDVCNPQGYLAIGGEWIELTNTDQIRMCGNSVSPYSACALVAAQFGMKRKEQVAA